MKRLDFSYITAGLVWLLGGMVFGIWLGITGQFNFANSHAHANLVGFTISTLFGLMHRSFPGLGRSRIASLQFIAYQIGAILLVLGKALIDANGGDNLMVKVGALIVVLATALMAWMFVSHGRQEA